MKNLPIVVVSLIVAVIASFGTATIVSQHSAPAQKAGALAGPVIPSPFLQWGGVNHWGAVDQFATGTSTLCAIQSPAATSTLKGVAVIFNSLPTYSTTYELGFSSALNATTTAIVASFTPAGNLNQFAATSTGLTTAGVNDGILAPNTWINFNLSTSTATGASVATGECTATFDQL